MPTIQDESGDVLLDESGTIIEDEGGTVTAMAVTSHVYPKAMSSMSTKAISLVADTFKMGLCTGDASAWSTTQYAYQFVSDVTGAYTEVVTGGYARVTLASLAVNVSGNKVIWTCASPISFGSSITLAARSAFIYDASIGSADASFPVIAILDFGATVSSTSGSWQYAIDGTNGLAYNTAN
jgi:hypothetical protein